MSVFTSVSDKIKNTAEIFKVCAGEIGWPRTVAATAVTMGCTLGGAVLANACKVNYVLPHYESMSQYVTVPANEVLTASPAATTALYLLIGGFVGFAAGLGLALPIVRNGVEKRAAALPQNKFG
ncbi:MAG: FxsA family protein [Alphaproteobacteria bacterium]|nr:FxsA family protein [Alphaproteobacteria bacterium]